MKDLIIPVNNEALARALKAIVGDDVAAQIGKAYAALDAAIHFGYERSQAEEAEKRKEMSEEYVKALQRAENGDDEEAYKSGYDDGYIDGVADARVCPAEADDRVAELCSEDDYGDTDSYYVGDSGDENDYFDNINTL